MGQQYLGIVAPRCFPDHYPIPDLYKDKSYEISTNLAVSLQFVNSSHRGHLRYRFQALAARSRNPSGATPEADET